MDYLKPGYIRFFVEVDALDGVGCEVVYDFSESVSEIGV